MKYMLGYLIYSPIKNFMDFRKNLIDYAEEYKYRYNKESDSVVINPPTYVFKFENDFFRLINIKNSIENWVDIENEYYKKLKTIVKSISMDIETKKKAVVKLNLEFDEVKNLLENYLESDVVDAYDFRDTQKTNYWGNFHNILRPISLFNNESKLFKEFNSKEDIDEIKKIFDIQKKDVETKTSAYFLNFNYTPTIDTYLNLLNNDDLNFPLNQIHGKVKEKDNPIIFGFGDEMDEDYKVIENINDNEYLQKFKSFQYLQNSNYDNLLSFINSRKFQACVLGHSCGLSDRVLLNTVFEHENCRSIKVYYYKRDKTDNYTDIIQNISRHFYDKSLMRKKIVNKTLCSPLPQTEIPKIGKN